MLQQLIDLQTGLNNIQTDVTAVQTDVSGVQADLTAVQADVGIVRADVGIVQSAVGNVKTGVEKLVTSDEEIQSIVICFEGSIGVEAEGALELVMGGHADAGVGAKAGTGAQADAFIDGAAVIKVGSVGDATIGLDLCTDLIKQSERLAQSSNTQATRLITDEDALIATLNQFWINTGLMGPTGEIDLARLQGMVGSITNPDLRSPNGLISLDSPLVTSISNNVPLPPALAGKLADPTGTADALTAEAIAKLDFCSPGGQPLPP